MYVYIEYEFSYLKVYNWAMDKRVFFSDLHNHGACDGERFKVLGKVIVSPTRKLNNEANVNLSCYSHGSRVLDNNHSQN